MVRHAAAAVMAPCTRPRGSPIAAVLWAALVAAVGWTGGAHADRVELASGDRLVGRVRAMDGQTLVMETAFAPRLPLERSALVALTTDAPVTLRFADGSYASGRLAAPAPGRAVLSSARFGRSAPFALDEIAALGPVGTAPVVQRRAPGGAPAGALTGKDRVVLHSGEALYGRIRRMEAGTLYLETDYAGTLELAQERIASLASVAPLTVKTRRGTYHSGVLTPARDGLALPEHDQPVAVEALVAIYREDPQALMRQRHRPRLSGHANVGIRRQSGNTRTEEYHLDTEIVARTPVNRYTGGIELNRERSEGQKVEDDTLIELQFDHFITEQWYLFNSASFEQDEVDQLDLRSAVAAGIGYQFYETDDGKLSGELGVTYVNEDFADDQDDNYSGGRWAIDFDWLLAQWVAFFHQQEGLFGLTDTSNVTIRTSTGLRFPLGNGFQATAQANVDWDRSPAEGTGSTDKEYLFTLGYSW